MTFKKSLTCVFIVSANALQLPEKDSIVEAGEGAGAEVSRSARHMGRALVVLSHWTSDADARDERWGALERTLGEIKTWPVESTIVLVTNKRSQLASGMVSQQVITGHDPQCSASFNHSHCLPWEALKALRNASATWTPGCNLNEKAVCGVPEYDYYVYSESDISTSKETFDFWATHAARLHQRGFLLVPHREEHFGSSWVVPDCWLRTRWGGTSCPEKLNTVYKDLSAAQVYLYSDPNDRMYLHLGSPYGGCFFLTRGMYEEWLRGPMWDYSRAMKLSKWYSREAAASGLMWDPHYGLDAALTHPKMGVVRQMPGAFHRLVRSKEKDFMKVSQLKALVQGCADDSRSSFRCRTLPEALSEGRLVLTEQEKEAEEAATRSFAQTTWGLMLTEEEDEQELH